MTQILDRDGRPGAVEADDGESLKVRLPSGAHLRLPASLADRQPDGSYRTDVSFDALDAERHTLAEVEERVEVSSVVRETGRVRVRTVTDTADERVDTSGWRETVEVERVPIGRDVDAVEGTRTEGDTTVIPVYEEVLVVHKQLVLREEVRITTRKEPTEGSERVALRRQRVEVDRLPPEA